MKSLTITVATLISLSAIAQAPTLVAFSLKGSDGKTYSNATLFAKPTVLVFMKKGCPHNPKAMADMNRIKRELGPKTNFYAVCDVNQIEAKSYATQLGAKFVILADKDQKLIKGSGAEFSLDMALVNPKTKRIEKLWNGYNNATISEIYAMIPKVGGEKPKMSASKFPKGTVSGCGF